MRDNQVLDAAAIRRDVVIRGGRLRWLTGLIVLDQLEGIVVFMRLVDSFEVRQLWPYA